MVCPLALWPVEPVGLLNRATGKPANGQSGKLTSCRFVFGQSDGIGAHFLDLPGKIRGILGKAGTFAGGQIEHSGPLSADADGFQNFLDLFNPSAGHQIARVIMTLTLQAADDTGAVDASFKGAHHMDDIDLPGAWNANNFHVRRILQSHGTCQVRCGVASEIAAECNDDRLKVFAHNLLLN